MWCKTSEGLMGYCTFPFCGIVRSISRPDSVPDRQLYWSQVTWVQYGLVLATYLNYLSLDPEFCGFSGFRNQRSSEPYLAIITPLQNVAQLSSTHFCDLSQNLTEQISLRFKPLLRNIFQQSLPFSRSHIDPHGMIQTVGYHSSSPTPQLVHLETILVFASLSLFFMLQ